MPSPPPLTPVQKRRLSALEPALRQAVYAADYAGAKLIVADLQSVLRATGHETRLMRSKTWLFEAALNAGEVHTAETGLRGVCAKSSVGTRVHLEALALLAVCLLRQGKLAEAEKVISEVVSSKAIKDSAKRERFIQGVSARFQLEACLGAARGLHADSLDPHAIDAAAVEAVRTKSDDELYAEISIALPRSVIEAAFRVDKAARLRLTHTEVALLPSPAHFEKRVEQGKCFFTSLKLVIWKSLCDPKSDIYQAWFTNGIASFMSKKYYAFVVTSALVDIGFAAKAIAVPATALLMKLGVEVYCERYRPGEILDGRSPGVA